MSAKTRTLRLLFWLLLLAAVLIEPVLRAQVASPPDIYPDQLSISTSSPGQKVAGWVSGDICNSSNGTTCASVAPATRVPFGPTAPTNGLILLNANYTADPKPLLYPNEVVAFTQGQLPQYVGLPETLGDSTYTWTPGSDIIYVTFTPSVVLPVQFWDVSSSPATALTMATLSTAFASTFYASQNTGITVQYTGIKPVPGVPINPRPGLPSSSVLGCSDVAPTGVLGAGVYHPENKLNVYITDVIENSHGNPDVAITGASCGGAILLSVLATSKALAATSQYSTLAHEIGHELSLAHPAAWECPAGPTTCSYGPPWFGFTMQNLMWPYWNQSLGNAYVTNGQVFRTTFDSRSMLNGGGGIDTMNTPEGPAGQAVLTNIFSPSLRSNSLGAPLLSFICDAQDSGATSYEPDGGAQCPDTCKNVWPGQPSPAACN
jgi:hypothetical protein